MNKNIFTKLLVVFLLFNSISVNAEETKTEDKNLQTLSNEQFFITATRSERNISTLPANVSIITSEDIEKSTAQTLPDIFKHLTGVDVREQFGYFSSTTVDVRGFGEVAAANTLIMVDGRRLNRDDLSGINFSTVPLNRIDKVEVYRGGRSVLYGNNAVGGVINIITKKDRPDGHTLTLQSEFGEYDTYKMSAFLDGKTGKTSYTFDSSYYDTNGFRTNNYERMKNTGFSVLIQEYDDWDIFISGNTSETRVGTPGARFGTMGRTDASSKEAYFEIDEKSLILSPRYWIDKDSSIELTSYYREGESFFTEGTTTNYYDYGISPKLVHDYYLADIKNTFITGIDYSHTKQLFGSERNLRSSGYYFYNTSDLIEDTLFLDLGYRRERYKINIDGSTQNFSPEDLDATSAGLTYQYAKNSKVFISYDKSFRYQRVDELGGVGFNEPLPPQKSRTFQTGISHEINNQLNLSLTYFNIETDNEIFYLGFPVYQNLSYEETSREGFEIELNYQLTETINLFANFTKIDAELGKDYSSNNINNGNEIPRVPQETINVGYSWDFAKNFNWTTAGKWADRHYGYSDFENNTQDDGYIVIDSKLTFTYDWFSIYAGCNNLFNEKYSSNTASWGDYPAPGRNFFGGLTLTFDF